MTGFPIRLQSREKMRRLSKGRRRGGIQGNLIHPCTAPRLDRFFAMEKAVNPFAQFLSGLEMGNVL
jgi:hypothetical protein